MPNSGECSSVPLLATLHEGGHDLARFPRRIGIVTVLLAVDGASRQPRFTRALVDGSRRAVSIAIGGYDATRGTRCGDGGGLSVGAADRSPSAAVDAVGAVSSGMRAAKGSSAVGAVGIVGIAASRWSGFHSEQPKNEAPRRCESEREASPNGTGGGGAIASRHR
jgi:hypothetical protein